MTENDEKQKLDNNAGLKLLRDIFGLAETFKPYLPAFLRAACEDEDENCNEECRTGANSESVEPKEVNPEPCNTCCENCETKECARMNHDGDCNKKKVLDKTRSYFMTSKSSFHYDGNGLNYKICYYGISKELIDDTDLFLQWSAEIYKDYFTAAYLVNMEADKYKKDDEHVMMLNFEFYSIDDKDNANNMAVTPWLWDNDMFSFYHEDTEGDRHYVRFIRNGNDVNVCEKDGKIVTDMLSEKDRQYYISMVKKNIDNMSMCNEKDDKMSYENKDNCCGTNFDNIENIFFGDSEPEVNECDVDMCTGKCCEDDDKCLNEECKQLACIENKEKQQTLGDIVCSYGYNVRSQSVRKNECGYSPRIKKIYKDILYEESNNEDRTLTKEELFELFEYMLDNKLYEYSVSGEKVILSISYEDMMANINKPGYVTNIPASKNLPWFMTPGSAPKLKPISWKDLNKQFLADSICNYYNFDEVVLIDMPSTDKDPLAEDRHCILCVFDAM